MIIVKRNPITQRFSGLPESFLPALMMLLRQLNDDELALEVRIDGEKGCHYRAPATWSSVALVTNKRRVVLHNTGEITEEAND